MKLQEFLNDDTCQIFLAIIIGIVICYFIFGQSCGSGTCNRDGFSVGAPGTTGTCAEAVALLGNPLYCGNTSIENPTTSCCLGLSDIRINDRDSAVCNTAISMPGVVDRIGDDTIYDTISAARTSCRTPDNMRNVNIQKSIREIFKKMLPPYALQMYIDDPHTSWDKDFMIDYMKRFGINIHVLDPKGDPSGTMAELIDGRLNGMKLGNHLDLINMLSKENYKELFCNKYSFGKQDVDDPFLMLFRKDTPIHELIQNCPNIPVKVSHHTQYPTDGNNIKARIAANMVNNNVDASIRTYIDSLLNEMNIIDSTYDLFTRENPSFFDIPSGSTRVDWTEGMYNSTIILNTDPGTTNGNYVQTVNRISHGRDVSMNIDYKPITYNNNNRLGGVSAEFLIFGNGMSIHDVYQTDNSDTEYEIKNLLWLQYNIFKLLIDPDKYIDTNIWKEFVGNGPADTDTGCSVVGEDYIVFATVDQKQFNNGIDYYDGDHKDLLYYLNTFNLVDNLHNNLMTIKNSIISNLFMCMSEINIIAKSRMLVQQTAASGDEAGFYLQNSDRIICYDTTRIVSPILLKFCLMTNFDKNYFGTNTSNTFPIKSILNSESETYNHDNGLYIYDPIFNGSSYVYKQSCGFTDADVILPTFRIEHILETGQNDSILLEFNNFAKGRGNFGDAAGVPQILDTAAIYNIFEILRMPKIVKPDNTDFLTFNEYVRFKSPTYNNELLRQSGLNKGIAIPMTNGMFDFTGVPVNELGHLYLKQTNDIGQTIIEIYPDKFKNTEAHPCGKTPIITHMEPDDNTGTIIGAGLVGAVVGGLVVACIILEPCGIGAAVGTMGVGAASTTTGTAVATAGGAAVVAGEVATGGVAGGVIVGGVTGLTVGGYHDGKKTGGETLDPTKTNMDGSNIIDTTPTTTPTTTTSISDCASIQTAGPCNQSNICSWCRSNNTCIGTSNYNGIVCGDTDVEPTTADECMTFGHNLQAYDNIHDYGEIGARCDSTNSCTWCSRNKACMSNSNANLICRDL